MKGKRNETEILRCKKWIITTLFLIIVVLVIFASITIYIDPFFHYHKPLKKYDYLLNNERYQNDGIIKNFKYESIITGTSMTENFKKSEADKIFGTNFIKVPFSGGHYKEINDNLERAFDINKNIKYVIRCLDYSFLVKDKNSYREDVSYPVYLYNDKWYDDVNYVLNKSILFEQIRAVIQWTKEGTGTTSFDDYVNWNSSYTFGAETVLSTYTLQEIQSPEKQLSDEERDMCLENIRQNVTNLAGKHPETTFYYFFPPYSIC